MKNFSGIFFLNFFLGLHMKNFFWNIFSQFFLGLHMKNFGDYILFDPNI